MGQAGRFRLRFQVSVTTAILAVIALVTAAAIGNVYYSSTLAAKDAAAGLFAEVSARVEARVDRQMAETLTLSGWGARMPVLHAPVQADGPLNPAVPLMTELLESEPALYSLYAGRQNGDFLQVIAARGDARVMTAHKAPHGTEMIVRTITGQGAKRVQRWAFLGRQGAVLGRAEDTAPEFDPRRRDWYGPALAASGPVLSAPYLFNSLQQPGITASRRLTGGDGVVGVDITLAGLAEFISGQKISANGGVVVLDGQRRVLAAGSGLLGSLPPLSALETAPAPLGAALASVLSSGKGPRIHHLEVGGREMMAHVSDWRAPSGQMLTIAVVAPFEDFTAHIRTMQHRTLLLIGLVMLIILPLAVIVSGRLARTVRSLAEEAQRVQGFDFSGSSPKDSVIIEFDALARAFESMKGSLSSKANALEVAQSKLEKLVRLGIGLSAEKDSNTLMEKILMGAKDLTNADGGTLYIRTEDETLRFQILRNDTLKVALGGASGDLPEIPAVPLRDAAGRPNHNNVVSYCVNTEKTVNIVDAYDSAQFDFSGTKVFDQRNGYRSQSFLTVPLKPRGGEVIGALQLIIAGAIDAKSPYTGGHCERVPELALMLAEEAGKVSSGPLADFAFRTEEEWREFKIGAWLHDCGKVVTPEYVVDKATKLETIYNRIHEVRTRFEVLLRDAMIDYLRGLIAGQEDEPTLRARLEERQTRLREDFAFIAECNVGGEFMAPDKVERLKQIGAEEWTRTLDDRLGLSHEELKRFPAEAPALPVQEKLLDDKPWHIIPRPPGGLERYKDLGFQTKIPEALYNFGEVYNLSVSRGTLSEEERFKINEHIMQTIAMLEGLPFPKHLKRVPEYAGTHHETMIGTGYPRKLDASTLSIPARIMAIADIFEALTASDRPYKKAKSLSESVKILSFFKKDKHIDGDLFDLFLTSGVYRTYAERFLLPEQMDEVDISQYVTPPQPAPVG